MVSDIPKWRKYVLDLTMPDRHQLLEYTAGAVMEALLNDEMIIFDGLVPEAVNALHLCVALRVTCRKLTMTSQWVEGVEVARQACILEGLDPADAMVGLLK